MGYIQHPSKLLKYPFVAIWTTAAPSSRAAVDGGGGRRGYSSYSWIRVYVLYLRPSALDLLRALVRLRGEN